MKKKAAGGSSRAAPPSSSSFRSAAENSKEDNTSVAVMSNDEVWTLKNFDTIQRISDCLILRSVSYGLLVSPALFFLYLSLLGFLEELGEDYEGEGEEHEHAEGEEAHDHDHEEEAEETTEG